MSFESLYIDPRGRAARASFIGALIILALVAAFYAVLVGGVSGAWCLVMLIYPFTILSAKRLHDMGQSGWLMILPAALLITTAYFYLYDAHSALMTPVSLAAAVVSGGFALWGLIGKSKAEGEEPTA